MVTVSRGRQRLAKVKESNQMSKVVTEEESEMAFPALPKVRWVNMRVSDIAWVETGSALIYHCEAGQSCMFIMLLSLKRIRPVIFCIGLIAPP